MPALVVTVVLAVGSGALAISEPVPHRVPERLPDSMAAIGDSITQAANAGPTTIGFSNPQHSWSTGTAPGDPVFSHYERIVARNPDVAGHALNVSVSGSRMRDAPAQAAAAVQHGAEYVTVLMGANDLCAPTRDAMTPVTAFEESFRQTLDILTHGLPEARIYVVSVPDVYQLWNVQRNNLLALLTWESFRICQSMLAPANTEADRLGVRNRNIDYNAVLRRVCGEHARCRYDDDRVFDYRFSASDVSTVDYFHPSISGQQHLAEAAWAGGYWRDV